MNIEGLEAIHSHEAEIHVLSGCLQEPEEVLGELIQDLLPEDFFNACHGKLFEVFVDMHEKGMPVDPTSIHVRLEDLKMLSAIGGTPMLGRIGAHTVTNWSVAQHVATVKQKSMLRGLQKVCKLTLLDAQERQYEPEAVFDDASASFNALTDSRPNVTRFFTTHDTLRLSLQRMENTRKVGKGLRGPSTGIPDLDRKIFGLEPKKMIIIGARTNVGKTYLAQSIQRHCNNSGNTCDMISLESPPEDLQDRELAMEGRVPLDSILSGSLTENQWNRIDVAIDTIKQWKRLIVPLTAPTIGKVRSEVRKLIRRNKSKVIIIDYLGLIRAKAENRREEISAISRGLQAICRECPETCFIILAQLNRDPEKENGRPALHHLKDSGQIEQDADIVLLLHRKARDDGEYSFEDAEIRVAKGRNVKKGIISMTVDQDTGEWKQKEDY